MRNRMRYRKFSNSVMSMFTSLTCQYMIHLPLGLSRNPCRLQTLYGPPPNESFPSSFGTAVRFSLSIDQFWDCSIHAWYSRVLNQRPQKSAETSMPDERPLLEHRMLTRRQAMLGAGSVLAAGIVTSRGIRAAAPDTLSRFRSKFGGKVIVPGDQSYETARLINNRIFDYHPSVIAECAGADDVARALAFAREGNMPVAIRSGGHSVAGQCNVDNGVLIDLGKFKQISIDRSSGHVTCGAGVRTYEVNQATAPAGLAVPLGVCGDVGVAGLTLGGGYGWLLGTAGLACDSLVSARVVMSDGRILYVDDEREPDLMWALRGAGANFGVVTELTFRALRVDKVFAGEIRFPPEQLHEVMELVNEKGAVLPDELVVFGGFMATGEKRVPNISLCWSGDPKRGADTVRALLSTLKPNLDKIRITSIPELVGRGEGTDGFSCTRYGFAHGRLDKPGLKALTDPTPAPAEVSYFASLDGMNGAITRRDKANSCAPRISPGVGASFLTFWEKPESNRDAVAWTQGAWDKVQPSTNGAYVNMLGEQSPERTRSAYRESYARLSMLKRRYDPENILRSNQNIAPAAKV
jgi:FAD/FMN-containing dehydrogenase